MRILLIDMDLPKRRKAYPNLALMKLSAHHKAKGDEVFLNFLLCQPDLTYASCVFSWHWDKRQLPANTIMGGHGTGEQSWLPPEIEHLKPDYSLYPGITFSLGFTSRGCTRHCPFCDVWRTEGHIQAWASVYEFLNPHFNFVVLMDNNIFAAPNWRETFKELITIGKAVDINQGLDIRLLDDEKIHYLKQIKIPTLRFAFDNLNYESEVRRGIEAMVKAGIRSRRIRFYVLVGFADDQTAFERMKMLSSYNVGVYPMIYKGKDGKEPNCKFNWDGKIFWHGNLPNLRKFLRVCGKL